MIIIIVVVVVAGALGVISKNFNHLLLKTSGVVNFGNL